MISFSHVIFPINMIMVWMILMCLKKEKRRRRRRRRCFRKMSMKSQGLEGKKQICKNFILLHVKRIMCKMNKG
jgi:hypothetical protein